ncbi:MAG: hypothetical protein ACJASR_002563 [Psychroserpens sp.]|jgi:hypothetical protein
MKYLIVFDRKLQITPLIINCLVQDHLRIPIAIGTREFPICDLFTKLDT